MCLQKVSRPLPFLICCHIYPTFNLVKILSEPGLKNVNNTTNILSCEMKSIIGIFKHSKAIVPSVTGCPVRYQSFLCYSVGISED